MRYLLFLLIPFIVFGQPSISDVTGDTPGDSLIHDSTFVVEGSNFGTKENATPLWWDDCEITSQEDSQVVANSGEITHVISYLTGSNKHYNSRKPDLLSDATQNLHYRTFPFRNVSAPHQFSNYAITGAHGEENECAGGPPGGNVMVTISDGINSAKRWIIFYWYRLDPLWYDVGSAINYKYHNWETTAPYQFYSSITNYDNVNGCAGGYLNRRKAPDCREDWWSGAIHGIVGPSATCGNSAQAFYPCVTHDTNVGNPISTWRHMDLKLELDSSFYQVAQDGYYVYNSEADIEGDCVFQPSIGGDVGGISIGGWWRHSLCGAGNAFGDFDDDSYRYFTDIYVDTTFSRVVIGNNSDYASCTIIEPQIPTAWTSDGDSITFICNRGGLTDNTGYLFVYDSLNVANSTGYEISFSATESADPNVPKVSGQGEGKIEGGGTGIIK